MNRQNIVVLLIRKVKFATTSAFATAIDYGIFLGLVYATTTLPYIANIISYSISMIINFLLQKKFIFSLERKLHYTFLLSVTFSLLGLVLSTSLIYFFSLNSFLNAHQYLTKLLVTGIVFFYNFYLKRFAFEKRML